MTRGGSPLSLSASTTSGARGSGTADSSSWVYGCLGLASTDSVGPDSTTRLSSGRCSLSPRMMPCDTRYDFWVALLLILFAGAQPGPVRLGDRGGRDGRPVELGEHLVGRL